MIFCVWFVCWLFFFFCGVAIGRAAGVGPAHSQCVVADWRRLSTVDLVPFFFAFLMEVFIDSPFSFRVASFGCFFFSILRSVADAAEEEAANGRTKQRNSPKK